MGRAIVRFLPLWILLITASAAHAAPEAELWARWTAHDPAAQATIDHGPWTAFLERHRRMGPNGVARLDYGGVDADARKHLQGYIDHLADQDIGRFSRPVQRAYWINLYNALTVATVLDHYPVASIRDIDISPGWFSNGPWDAKLIEVDSVELSLNDIEHRILRPIWEDPRIHYAVNCASLGCPNLQPVAFTAANTERLLDDGAHAYVNHPRGVGVEGEALVVSSIYHWFRADFGGTERGVLDHLERYADEPLRAVLMLYDGYDDHRYDWSLNDVTATPESANEGE